MDCLDVNLMSRETKDVYLIGGGSKIEGTSIRDVQQTEILGVGKGNEGCNLFLGI